MDREKCLECNGQGEIRCEKCDGHGECWECGHECEECDGEGWIECEECGGSGWADGEGEPDPLCEICGRRNWVARHDFGNATLRVCTVCKQYCAANPEWFKRHLVPAKVSPSVKAPALFGEANA